MTFGFLFSYGPCIGKNPQQWIANDTVITQTSARVLDVDYGDMTTAYSFHLDIYSVHPNPNYPFLIVLTYDAEEYRREEALFGKEFPPNFLNCFAWLINLESAERLAMVPFCTAWNDQAFSPWGHFTRLDDKVIETQHLAEYIRGEGVPCQTIPYREHRCLVIDSDSWRWITPSVIRFSGGACGAMLEFLYDLDRQELEKYCAAYQKSEDYCPESKADTAVLKKRLEALERDKDSPLNSQ